MTVERREGDSKGEFVAYENGSIAGKMTFSNAGSRTFIIDHTEVNPEFSGKGVGKEMVMADVAYARENGKKIIPICPFALSVFNKDSSLSDVRSM